jgi:hypothetical protein
MVMVRFPYMSWFDEQIRKRDDLLRRDWSIETEAPNLYSELWNALIMIVNEATQKQQLGFKLLTGGSNSQRWILAASGPDDERKLTVEFFKETNSIHTSHSEQQHAFHADACRDGLVCLKENGREITVQKAAEATLGSFLFPELHRKGSPAL